MRLPFASVVAAATQRISCSSFQYGAAERICSRLPKGRFGARCAQIIHPACSAQSPRRALRAPTRRRSSAGRRRRAPAAMPRRRASCRCLGGAEQQLVDVGRALADLQGDVDPGLGCCGARRSEPLSSRSAAPTWTRSGGSPASEANSGEARGVFGSAWPGSRRQTERAWRGWRSDPDRRARSSTPPSWSDPPSRGGHQGRALSARTAKVWSLMQP